MSDEIVHIGQVVEVEGRIAKVRTKRSEACASCAAGSLCHAFGEKHNEVEVENTLDAKPGQEVLLLMSSTSLVGASLTVYLVPLFFVLGFAVLGYHLAEWTNSLSQDTGLLIGVGVGLLLSFFVNRKLSDRLSRREAFQVRMAWPNDERSDAC